MCYSKSREKRRKSKTSNTRIFHYFSDSPRTKSQCVFWQRKTFRLTGIGIILVYISYWPDPGPLAVPCEGWVWQGGRTAPIPLHHAAESSGMESGAGGSTCWHKSRQCAMRLFITRLSASQKAIGSLFLFSKNLPLCIAHIQLTIRCYADQCPKYQSSQMFARALGKPYGLGTICILSWMCFNFYLLASAIVFTIF